MHRFRENTEYPEYRIDRTGWWYVNEDTYPCFFRYTFREIMDLGFYWPMLHYPFKSFVFERWGWEPMLARIGEGYYMYQLAKSEDIDDQLADLWDYPIMQGFKLFRKCKFLTGVVKWTERHEYDNGNRVMRENGYKWRGCYVWYQKKTFLGSYFIRVWVPAKNLTNHDRMVMHRRWENCTERLMGLQWDLYCWYDDDYVPNLDVYGRFNLEQPGLDFESLFKFPWESLCRHCSIINPDFIFNNGIQTEVPKEAFS